MEPMSDGQVYEMLQLLHMYVTEVTPDIPQTLSALADDLADSLAGVFAPADKPRMLADEIKRTTGVS